MDLQRERCSARFGRRSPSPKEARRRFGFAETPLPSPSPSFLVRGLLEERHPRARASRSSLCRWNGSERSEHGCECVWVRNGLMVWSWWCTALYSAGVIVKKTSVLTSSGPPRPGLEPECRCPDPGPLSEIRRDLGSRI